jgi:pimeloyl-ACP methyl ester carboxylesterase
MKKAAANPANALNRPKDITFAIDQLTAMNSDEKALLENHMDLKKVGMAGHSFGSLTTLVIAGQKMVGPNAKIALDYADKRILAGIPMSSPALQTEEQRKAGYASVHCPLLHMTGTKDHSPVGKTTIAQRRVPFDCIKTVPQMLITFDQGDHMVFSGQRRKGDGSRDPLIHSLILQSSTAWWDWYLKNKEPARVWLEEGGLKEILGAAATLETKQPEAEVAEEGEG